MLTEEMEMTPADLADLRRLLAAEEREAKAVARADVRVCSREGCECLVSVGYTQRNPDMYKNATRCHFCQPRPPKKKEGEHARSRSL